MIENKKILVIGLGKSGYNVSKLLASYNEIIVTDKNDIDENVLKEFNDLNITFIKSSNQEELLDNSFDLIVRNPGVDPHNEIIKKAIGLNIPFTNEMEIAYHYLPKNTKIIGITGSNGKTTTTTMIYELLKEVEDNVYLGGNIGYPLSELIPTLKDNAILVLEISDHQLYDMKDFKCDVSILTNLCPTHLDFHDTYDNYKNVKKKIFNHQDKNNIAIINYQNEDSLLLTKDINSSKKYFNGNNAYINRDAIYINNKFVIALDDIKVKGNHNYENIMAALLALDEYNIDNNIIKEYFSSFKGVEHRLEYVNTINKVSYYNDSKSTNPTSTITALSSFKDNIHLILGGYERKQDFNELNEYLNRVKYIYAIGETSSRIISWGLEKNVNVIECKTLKEAFNRIINNTIEGDVVLLSPASASWDQYKKFEDRGDEFKKLVSSLEGNK